MRSPARSSSISPASRSASTSDNQPVYLKDIWPTNQEVADTVRTSVTPEMFEKRYGDVFKGDANWQKIKVGGGMTYAWDPGSTYVQNPPYFDDMTPEPKPVADIIGARILGLFGDSITTDHISPAGSIKKDGPAGQYLLEHQVRPDDFNSYGSRRGNHEVMMRGTFANIRIKNEMLGGKEGGNTIHLARTATEMPIYDAAMQYQREGVPLVDLRRQGIRHRLVARLGGQRHGSSRRACRDRRKLRAHPPLESDRHGRGAVRVHRRRRPARAWT